MYLDIPFNSLAAIVVAASDKRWGEKAWVEGQSRMRSDSVITSCTEIGASLSERIFFLDALST